jgi:hypothetical protein
MVCNRAFEATVGLIDAEHIYPKLSIERTCGAVWVHAAQRRPFLAFFVAHSAGFCLLSQAQTSAPLHPPALQTPMNNLG